MKPLYILFTGNPNQRKEIRLIYNPRPVSLAYSRYLEFSPFFQFLSLIIIFGIAEIVEFLCFCFQFT